MCTGRSAEAVAKKVLLSLGLVLVLTEASTASDVRGGSRANLAIKIPNTSRELVMARFDLRLKEETESPDGAARVMIFADKAGRTECRVAMKPSDEGIDAAQLRQHRLDRIRSVSPEIRDVVIREREGLHLLEFLSEARGAPRSKYVLAFLQVDSVAIEVRLASRDYLKSDQKRLNAFVNSIRVVPEQMSGEGR
jgi:hypothetical protein